MKAKTEMRVFIRPLRMMMMEVGWGNGYVVIPKGHKLYGKDYDSLEVAIHGGLTFASEVDDLDWDELEKKDKGGWVVGFDCAHLGDTQSNCPMSYVKKEADNLKNQLEKLS